MSEFDKIIGYQAGHTVAAEILEESSVDLVTVRKNTGDAGGLTCYHLVDDYWISKTHMVYRVIAILAGKPQLKSCSAKRTLAQTMIYIELLI